MTTSDDPFTFYPLQTFHAPSRTDYGKVYRVTLWNDSSWSCECEGYQYRRFCKHIDRCRMGLVQSLQVEQESEVIKGDGLKIEL